MPSLRPICWDGDAVAMLDQRVLPHERKTVTCARPQDVIRAIRNMTIRGAPAIGVAGAMALALGAREIVAADPKTFRTKFAALARRVKAARPTGSNLAWAVERVYARVIESPRASIPELRELIRREADAILEEDVAANKAMGLHGARAIPPGATIMTHCNAGALATADYGTALGVVRAAFAADPRVKVIACETRPFLQGARLTAFELSEERIPVTLVTDNAAGSLMHRGLVDVIVVGADRIAANGDTANKIGTYSLAVLAKANDVPFYIAAPRSTIDVSIPDGDAIPIEQRDPKEVTHFRGIPVAPHGVPALNPAFDVTPHRYIAGIITEVGILRKPFTSSIRKAMEA